MRYVLLVSLVAMWGTWPSLARAEVLYRASGRVALSDGESPSGVRVRLFVDLNRDGKPDKLEVANAASGADGRYTVRLELDASKVSLDDVRYAAGLIAAYEKEGLESLLKAGPLPLLLSFEREGYSTIVRRLAALSDGLELDATLSPLSKLQCSDEGCAADDGSVEVRGLVDGMGIARAHAQAFDPGRERARFPGAFADDDGNLLLSSAFAELTLHRADGTPIHSLDAPVGVRMEVAPGSLAALVDLKKGSAHVELPMYSFDAERGQWVREADGQLVDESGAPVPESAFADVRAGKAKGRFFVAFETAHLSFFNCDDPVESRACVKGRLLDASGKAVVGASVSLEGVSYSGSAGAVVTDALGYFAGDVMKSENDDEDVNDNGARGETLTARIVASGSGIFQGEPFATPSKQGSVFRGSGAGCRGAACECFDLGDVEADFESPRACEVRVEARFSGRHTWGDGGPLEAGDAATGAIAFGQLSGIDLAVDRDGALCGELGCDARVDGDARARFVIPVVGDAPLLEIDVKLDVREGETHHTYSGSASISGCAAGEARLDKTVSVELDHMPLEDIGGFFGSLAEGAAEPIACDCGVWHRKDAPRWASWLLSLSLVGALGARRRHRR